MSDPCYDRCMSPLSLVPRGARVRTRSRGVSFGGGGGSKSPEFLSVKGEEGGGRREGYQGELRIQTERGGGHGPFLSLEMTLVCQNGEPSVINPECQKRRA